jgi:hypothetical protein
MHLATVLIFAYNRPKHISNLLESLEKCKMFKKFNIFIYIDGYKIRDVIDKKKVLEVQEIVKNFSFKYKNIFFFFNKKNLGLYNSIITGVTQVLKKHLSVIVLEDDLMLDKNFLVFMNKALTFSKNKEQVCQISGYSYPIKYFSNNAYYSTLSSCWGWGIYKKDWSDFINFIKNKKKIRAIYKKMSLSKRIVNSFNFNNTFNYFRIFSKQVNSSISSWGILFYLFCFYKKKLILYPPYSLVKNAGFDGSGYHKSFSDFFNSNKDTNKKFNIIYPKQVFVDDKIKSKIEFFFQNKLSYFSKFKNLIYNSL